MNVNVTPIDAGGSVRSPEIVPVSMSDGQIDEMRSVLWFRKFHLRRRAGALFDLVNGATAQEAWSRLAYLDRPAKAAAKRMRKEERKLRRAVNFYAKTPEVGETGFRMDRRQLTTMTIFVFLRFLLLAVTIWLVVRYARASEVLSDVNVNWAMAVVFGLPALMCSWVLSSVADILERRSAKRWIAIFYTILGTLAIFLWAMIGIQSSDPTVAAQNLWLHWTVDVTGFSMLLFCLLIISDILIGAACLTWAKLSFLVGRVTEFRPSKEYAEVRTKLAEAADGHRNIENEIALLRLVLRTYHEERQNTVRDALARFSERDGKNRILRSS